MYLNAVLRLVGEIKRGRWVTTGVPIILDENGYVIDGQHRLQAIVDSGQSVWVWVCRGVSRKAALPVIDLDSKSRRLEDLLKMYPVTGINGKLKEIENGSERKNAAAATTLLYTYRNKRFLEDVFVSPSTQEYYEFLGGEAGLLEHLDSAGPLGSFIPNSVVIFLRYVLGEQSKRKADDFLRKVAVGEDLSESHPILTLRNKLIRYQSEKRKDPVNRRSREDLIFIFFKAWLYHLAGEKLTRLQWRKRASEKRPAEPFLYLDDYPTAPAELRRVLKERPSKAASKAKSKKKR
jgi:hypothetical protein